MFSYATDERFPADEAQLAVPDRDHGGRSRQPVDDREFSNDRAWTTDRQYPLVTLRRSDADLEQALLKPIATIGSVASLEQHFSFGERSRLRVCQDALRKLDRQVGQYAGEAALRHTGRITSGLRWEFLRRHGWNNRSERPRIRIILIHITDARRGDCITIIVRDFAVPSRGWRGAV